MHVSANCFSCLFQQALNTANHAMADEAQKLLIMQESARYLSQQDVTTITPARLSQPIYAIVSRVTGLRDPFAEIKKKSNALAQSLQNDIRDAIVRSRDPLNRALHAAAAGNIIDAGIIAEMDMEILHEEIQSALYEPFYVDDLPRLYPLLKRGSSLLYLADNAGEIVFDALAIDRIQRMGVVVTVAVKSGPIINDATLEDAQFAGLPGRCTVIETGAADIGVDWNHATPAFRSAFDSADVVLAKGHGHLETLNSESHPGLFFLLKAKCSVVADALQCPTGSLVFAHVSRLQSQDA